MGIVINIKLIVNLAILYLKHGVCQSCSIVDLKRTATLRTGLGFSGADGESMSNTVDATNWVLELLGLSGAFRLAS